MSHRKEFKEDDHVLLVQGYCRKEEKEQKITLHGDIVSVCIAFHGPFYEILKWNKEFIQDVINDEYEDEDMHISVSEGFTSVEFIGRLNHTNIIPDTEPVFEGIHCWRANVENTKKEWIMFGVSHRDIDIQMAWNCKDVIAFQSKNWFNGNGKWNGIKTGHFQEKINLEVDLLLDIDNKKLNACVVGECIEGKEVKIWDFKIPYKGFVPYFNLFSKGQRLQLMKIPIGWYGVHKKDLFYYVQ